MRRTALTCTATVGMLGLALASDPSRALSKDSLAFVTCAESISSGNEMDAITACTVGVASTERVSLLRPRSESADPKVRDSSDDL